MGMQSKPGVNSDDVIRQLYKMALAWRPNRDEYPIEAFLSGAMVVLSEVFPDPKDPELMSPVIPKQWMLMGRKSLMRYIEERYAMLGPEVVSPSKRKP